MEKLISSYPVTIDLPVQWGDMDSFQHVNNTVYLRFFENARIAYLSSLGLEMASTASGVGIILAETRCRYRVPLTHPDTVVVGAKTTDIGVDRFEMQYVVVSQRLQKVAATGSGLIVGYDYDKSIKAALKPAWVDKMKALQPEL